jgi:tRNA1Val (adenine37-N6)-methyltransferase
MFQFKQFIVDQSNCAMKINTDGVLLGALLEAKDPQNILDIGTGTGVIALMLAQRFEKAYIEAVEINELAAATALNNFQSSPFADRLNCYPLSFEEYYGSYTHKKFDLIVSNPPYYINSLHSPEKQKQVAKHADQNFFKDLMISVSEQLSGRGSCWLILPKQTAELIKTIGTGVGLYIKTIVHVRSFADQEPHREIMELSFKSNVLRQEQFVIYESKGVYTSHYQQTLKEFFTIY